jgi:hypothetical protein
MPGSRDLPGFMSQPARRSRPERTLSLPQPIPTRRLSLHPAGEAWLTTLISSAGAFSLISGLGVAEGCNEFPDALRFSLDCLRRASPNNLCWCAPLLFVDPAARLVVGMGGYKGPPMQGAIEFGYSIAPAHRGRGLATEAAEAMANFALKQPGVECVFAHTLPMEGPSPRVLEKCGFVRAGEGMDPREGVVWRWERRR